MIEDAACAVGSELSFNGDGGWDKIGKPHGDVACFSFHPRKILTTGDGGMLTTNDGELEKKFKLWRQHSMSIPDTVRHNAKNVIFEEYLTTGYNYRMTDIQAAVGIEQLKKIDRIVDKRRQLADTYKQLLHGTPMIVVPTEPEWARTNWQSYPIRIKDGARQQQKNIMQHMQEHGVATRRGIMNSLQEHPYSEVQWSLPVSEKCRDLVILLPLFDSLTNSEQQKIVHTLQEALQK